MAASSASAAFPPLQRTHTPFELTLISLILKLATINRRVDEAKNEQVEGSKNELFKPHEELVGAAAGRSSVCDF